MIGVPWADSFAVGRLIAVKLVFNEFVAFKPGIEWLKINGLLFDFHTMSIRGTKGTSRADDNIGTRATIGNVQPGEFCQLFVSCNHPKRSTCYK